MKFLFYFLICNIALAYEIVKFDSNVVLGSKEKSVKHEIYLKNSHNLKQMQWSFPIIDTQQIHPLQFSVKKKFYKVYLKNNRVFFTIFDVKKDETLEINISYKVLNSQKFLQLQTITIPTMNKKFGLKMQVEIDKNWEIFSQNQLFYKQKDKYIYEGIVEKKPFKELFWLSLKEATWDIGVKNYIYSNKEFENIKILIPKYFKDSENKIKKMALNTSEKNAQIIQNVNSTSFVFRGIRSQDFMVEMNARISNSVLNNRYKNLNPELFLPDKENEFLRKTTEDIMRKNPNMPFYIAIGKWLNENIKYDEKFVSKHMNSEQILRVRHGVCEHYAQLFNDMMQSINVPSVFVTGVGFNPAKNKFEYHAWNLIYVNDEWIPIDSTWGIFSGKLPVSHIFFYTGYQPLMMYETYEVPIKEIQTNIEQKIELVQ